MSEHLFAYGTLQPHRAPAALAPAVDRLRSLGAGTVRGYLYDLGDYPGAIVDEAAKAKIHGTVFAMPDDAKLLRLLDEYEGFDPSKPGSSLFLRRMERVSLQSGRVLRCWMYVFNRGVSGARPIPGGEYGRQVSRANVLPSVLLSDTLS